MNASRHPRLQEAWRLDRAGQREPALAAYRAFLAREPGSAAGWADLGGLLAVLERPAEAEQACLRALGIEPQHSTAQINLASALMGLGRLDQAEALCHSLLARDSAQVEARLALAHCLIRRGDPVQARAVLEEALARSPGNREAARLLKHLSAMAGDWTQLRQDMERELDGYSGPEREHEAAHLQLLFGELVRGWASNEARLRVPGLIKPVRQFAQPAWEGRPFPGSTLLLHWEQGFGDTLMFVRYAPLVKALGGRVLVSVQPELAGLVATCPGVDQVVAHGEPLPPFDLQLSLVSLPHVFQTCLETLPADIPYLDLPELIPNRQAITAALAASQGRIRIGLAWAGNPGHRRDAERSLDPGALAPLARLPGVAWHSFQIGREAAIPLPDTVALGPLLGNFSDTAYALSGMDLVITVDTALLHLAGALGVPALALLPFCPDFRWLLHRSDSPWYPSVRLYRQPVPGDWTSVIREVVRDLS